jgi:hypothetical protein
VPTSTKMELFNEEPKCSICDQTYFKVERIAPDKIRLTCENCGEQHLLVIKSETTKPSSLKFEVEKVY